MKEKMLNEQNINIKEVLNEINTFGKMLTESYVFDEEDDDFYGEDVVDSVMSDENMSNIDNKIDQIRSLALDGIQEFAHDVDSKQYDFFKKIWLMCDKVYSEKDKENENKEV
jgi:hypothetical protein